MLESKIISNKTHPAYSPNDFLKKPNEIIYQLKKHGIILITEFFSNLDAINAANKLGFIVENLDADNQGITEISNKKTGNNKKNSAAFTNQKLYLHTDRSPLQFPPGLLMNWMCIKNCDGGEVVLTDGQKIFNYIKSNQPDFIDMLTNTDVACFTDGIDTFTGSIFNFNNQNQLEVRFRYDSCSFFKLEAEKAIKYFIETANKLANIIDLNIGDGYIINNNRWLHGRKSFNGYRTVKRIHLMEKC